MTTALALPIADLPPPVIPAAEVVETVEVAVATKFKAGDRVRVYGPGVATHGNKPSLYHYGGIAYVQNTTKDTEYIEVEFPDDTVIYTVHPKQCRRLKPRPPRRPVVWLRFNECGDVVTTAYTPRADQKGWRKYLLTK